MASHPSGTRIGSSRNKGKVNGERPLPTRSRRLPTRPSLLPARFRLVPARPSLLPTRFRLVSTRLRLVPARPRRLPTRPRGLPTRPRRLPTWGVFSRQRLPPYIPPHLPILQIEHQHPSAVVRQGEGLRGEVEGGAGGSFEDDFRFHAATWAVEEVDYDA